MRYQSTFNGRWERASEKHRLESSENCYVASLQSFIVKFISGVWNEWRPTQHPQATNWWKERVSEWVRRKWILTIDLLENYCSAAMADNRQPTRNWWDFSVTKLKKEKKLEKRRNHRFKHFNVAIDFLSLSFRGLWEEEKLLKKTCNNFLLLLFFIQFNSKIENMLQWKPTLTL